MNRKSLGIYIHIPFCVQKCLYCDFVSGPATIEIKRDYVNQLLKEIEIRAEQLCPFSSENGESEDNVQEYGSAKDYVIDSVFIGGGTPSVLDGEWIKEILCKLKKSFYFDKNCECSIEVNPGTVDYEKLLCYRQAGINRLSIGLQSYNDNELKALGRIHDYAAFEETYRLARKAGFTNINIDLMSAIPEQTEESFNRSLKQICELGPEHLSVYSLIVEESTPFYDMDLKLPNEEEERQMYHNTAEMLKKYGYEQYEISNYAKPGRECRHNLRYWRCEEYIGFGCAAASFVNGVRWKNTENRTEYMKYLADGKTLQGNFYCEKEMLTESDKMSEFFILGLRMNRGVSLDEFKEKFGRDIYEAYNISLENHLKHGLLEIRNNRIALTDRGRDLGNYVMRDFL
ncbi:MAG: radical SAM family heme chaperone HemW [Lachnospiraceae bacterium]|nr:radical SAM family heme chaperone HemW [Lachnospiraceae bacterium]